MSVAEIKEALPKLSEEERAEIARALLDLKQADRERTAADFAEAKAYVFDHYGELLRRLAQ